jgi:hypothetical protein
MWIYILAAVGLIACEDWVRRARAMVPGCGVVDSGDLWLLQEILQHTLLVS